MNDPTSDCTRPTLVDRYGFDAVYLDTIHVWTNDPDHDVYEGIRALAERLRAGRPDLLVTAEGWYDGLLAIFPVFMAPYRASAPQWFGRYACQFGHLIDGEPSRGSTGCHELGHEPYAPTPLEAQMLPTVSFVDGTLENARPAVEAIIEQAKAYARTYLQADLL